MFNEAVCNSPYALRYAPAWFKTGKMCKEAARREPCTLGHVPDHFKTQVVI